MTLTTAAIRRIAPRFPGTARRRERYSICVCVEPPAA